MALALVMIAASAVGAVFLARRCPLLCAIGCQIDQVAAASR